MSCKSYSFERIAMLKSLILSLMVLISTNLLANDKVIKLAVGHDHVRMISPDYPVYKANWEFINESLALLDYSVHVTELPWARAKHSVQNAKSDGLFIAANLPGRDQWAKLSSSLGYGIFGGFYHIDRPQQQEFIASVRVGEHDQIFSSYPSKEMLLVATAHQGFKLLFNKRIDRFLISESYGKYLLNTELKQYKKRLKFDTKLTERRSMHIAFSKTHTSSLKALETINKAIKLGIEQGLYQKAMTRNNVPNRMWVEIKK